MRDKLRLCYAHKVKTREERNEYMREYMKRRYHQLRAEAVEILGGKCAVCGTTEALEIDHVNRSDKRIDLGKITSVSRARFMEELKVCQLLCEEHHQRKTSRESSVPHGGGKTGKRNCLCELCRPLKNAYARDWKQRNKQASLAQLVRATDS